MTPPVAIARHLEWLEYALAAARAEERWRRGRLDNATKKNRPKREVRLAEVAAEIDELSALLVGLRDLEQRASRPKRGRPASTGRRRTAAGGTRRRARTTRGGAGTG